MAAAVEAFGTKEYEKTRVDDIVTLAGATRGAFYYYFSGKADVARDLQEELWGAAGDRAPKVVDPESDFLTKAHRSVEEYLTALRELGSKQAFLHQVFSDPSLAMIDGDGNKWGAHFIKEFLVQAMERGDIPHQDLDDTIPPFVEAFQALTLAALNGDDVTDAVRTIDELNESLLHPDSSHSIDDLSSPTERRQPTS